jgi:hypothetical protein
MTVKTTKYSRTGYIGKKKAVIWALAATITEGQKVRVLCK